MSNAAEIESGKRTGPRTTRAGMVAALVVCAAYLSYLWFWPMYREYDPIPFTWSSLEWHKAAILIPWLAIGIAYARYRLLTALVAHAFVAALFSLGWACGFAFSSEALEDRLDFAYRLINFDSQWLAWIIQKCGNSWGSRGL
jgi:hypothetical protein